MRILTIQPVKYLDYADDLAQMHQRGANVFRKRLEWDVTVTESREFDEYDTFNPAYILATTDHGRVVRCSPSSGRGPTMLERTFVQLLGSGSLCALPTIVESSWFCVDRSLTKPRGGGQLHRATLTVFAGTVPYPDPEPRSRTRIQFRSGITDMPPAPMPSTCSE